MPTSQTRPTDPESWRRLLAEQAQSGLSQRAFAEARGWPAYLLSYWKRCLFELAPEAATPTPTFVPLTLAVAPAPTPTPTRQVQRAPFELHLPGARMLRIPPDFEADALQRLLRALHEVAC